MSVFGLEQALYDISVKRDVKAKFKVEPNATLAAYALTDEERSLVQDFAVRELYRRGVNPMLTMGFWMEAHASRSMPDYLAAMRQGAG